MVILVERASWWNGHLGGTGILVERASCPFQFPGGQYAHATHINPLIQKRCSPVLGRQRGLGGLPRRRNLRQLSLYGWSAMQKRGKTY
ncbi:MAG: hypothetical protein F6K50_49590, partial [Moorea sp. SIO3I7]|nr:hypothetical protein [Moorena sp. SIO3I7]